MFPPLPDRLFRQVFSRVPRLCIDIIIEKKGGIVLVKRDIPPRKGYWHLPGGTVRFREPLRHAVERVAKDETGLRVRVVRQLGVVEYSRLSSFGHGVSIVYFADALTGELRGNKYGRAVKSWRRLPLKFIPEQLDFLRGLHIANSGKSDLVVFERLRKPSK